MKVTGHTRVFGLVGHPVRHSLSPAMHTALFQRHGVDGVYVAFDVHPDQAGEVARAVRTLDIRGVNLTVPFKTAILPDLDHVTRAAAEAGPALLSDEPVEQRAIAECAARNMAEALFHRPLEFDEIAWLEAVTDDFEASGYDFTAMVEAIVSDERYLQTR